MTSAITDGPRQSQDLGLLARLVLICLIVLAAAGVIWYGVTISTIQRLWRQLIERPYGPMAFRFILQPLMAAIVAFLHGRKDARIGRTSYFWAMVRNGKERVERLREALNDVIHRQVREHGYGDGVVEGRRERAQIEPVGDQ